MNWGAPQNLVFLWLLLPAAWLLLWLGARRRRGLMRLVDPRVVPQMAQGLQAARLRRLELLWLAAIALLLTALARPQWGVRWEEVRRRGLDIMVVLDTSRSMLATDLRPNRLQQAKWALRDLVEQLRGDRVGLVSFAGSSFLQCPLTIDYSAFLMTLDDVYAGIIPRGGTAIGQALDAAIDGFDEDTASDRVIILVSDGENHEPIEDGLLDRLAERDIRVFAIGAATPEGELVPDPSGGGGFVKDRAGRVIKSSLDESTLQRIALASGGAYVRAAAGDFGVERILEEGLADLKRDESESRLVRRHEDRYTAFIGAALLLLLLEAAFRLRGGAPRRAPA